MKADLVGQRFGKLTVSRPDRRGDRRIWLCVCDCGNLHGVTTGNLRSGRTTNCGCSVSESRRRAHLSHGQGGPRRSKEYRAWAHIKGRCTNPADRSYQNYGGRGITMHPAWVESFEKFLADLGQAPSPSHTVDRINNDGNYEPGNVRWATRAQQSRNTRRSILVDGKCLRDVCTERGLSYEAVQMRLRRGHGIEMALSALTGHAYRAMIAAAPSDKVVKVESMGKAK